MPSMVVTPNRIEFDAVRLSDRVLEVRIRLCGAVDALVGRLMEVEHHARHGSHRYTTRGHEINIQHTIHVACRGGVVSVQLNVLTS